MLLLASLGLPPKTQPASDFSVSLNVCLPTASLLESTPAELSTSSHSAEGAGASPSPYPSTAPPAKAPSGLRTKRAIRSRSSEPVSSIVS